MILRKRSKKLPTPGPDLFVSPFCQMSGLPRVYRALQLSVPGPVSHFQLRHDVPLRPPAPHQVVVRVAACGIAFRDIVDRRGGFKFISRPAILGHEFAGTVVSCGDQVTKYRVGDRVLSLHWDQSEMWPSPLPTAKGTSPAQSFFGLTTPGGYGEFVTCGQGAFVRCPKGWSSVEACSVVSTYGTMHMAGVVRAGIKAGESVLVTGAGGGLGTASIHLFLALGCRVTAATSTPSKAAWLRSRFPQLRNVVLFDASPERSGRLVSVDDPTQPYNEQHDAVLECVGGPTFATSLRHAKGGGRVVLVGNVGDNATPPLPLGMLILNSISVIGSDSIAAAEFDDNLAPFMEKHGLRAAVDRVVELEDVPKIHEELESKRTTGRVVAKLTRKGDAFDW